MNNYVDLPVPMYFGYFLEGDGIWVRNMNRMVKDTLSQEQQYHLIP